MFIINQIRDIVEKSIDVKVFQQQEHGKYPVIVTDKTDSVTSGWSVKYLVNYNPKFNSVWDPTGHFAELRITQFNGIYGLIGKVYSQFTRGENVIERYGTNYAEYEENGLWFTVFEQQNKKIKIAMTVTDSKSPFHMMKVDFYISINNNQPVLSGYDKCYNPQDGSYVDRFNAFMMPAKKRFIPVTGGGNNTPSVAKVSGVLTPDGLVAINEEQTEIVYIPDFSTTNSRMNERRLLASIYEKIIMDVAFERVADELSQVADQAQNIPAQTQNPFQPQSNPFAQPSFNPFTQQSQPQAQSVNPFMPQQFMTNIPSSF